MALAGIRNLRKQWFPPAPKFTEKNVPSQKGKVFIVTGGNAGVGYALIKLLYSTGATIYMASRSKVSPKTPYFNLYVLTFHLGESRKGHRGARSSNPSPKNTK
jgi:hypothetical protein